jgi:hypothetical protein
MKDTGAGKLVTELRKHPSSSKLAEAARQIRETWMRSAGVVNVFASFTCLCYICSQSSKSDAVPPTVMKSEDVVGMNIISFNFNIMNTTSLTVTLPEAVRLSSIRSNAVKLLSPALLGTLAAVRFEEDIFQSLRSVSLIEDKSRYLECVTRFAAQLQNPEFRFIREAALKSGYGQSGEVSEMIRTTFKSLIT